MNGDFRVGPWTVRPSLNIASQNGTTEHLEPKVMEVLVCLASRAGQTVAKEEILKSVWPDTFVSDDALIRSVSEIRRVFRDDVREPRFVQTIPKRGYRLVAPVESLSPTAGRSGSLAQEQLGSHRRRSQMIAAASVICVLVALVLAFAFDPRNPKDRLLGNKAPSIHALAVLPLQNLSDDPKQDYFAAGVTDALITDLAQIGALRVVSRTTIMRYGRPDKPLPQIARELNVDGIVEGTVQRSGDRVRITAQLIYGPADQHIWANSFEREVQDVLGLQNELASEIVKQLQVKLTPGEQAWNKNPRPVNPKALDAYVEARFHIGQAANLEYSRHKTQMQYDETRKAASDLDRALREDPNYIPAYIAYFDVIDAQNTSQLEYLPKARAALTKALQIDDSNVAAHLRLGRLLMQYDYNWADAEREYRRAIQLNPNSADAHFEYSEYLTNMGRSEEGDKERDLAQALNPAQDYFGGSGFQRVGWSLEQQRQALEEQGPNDPFALATMGKGYAVAGRFKDAVEMYERCLHLYGWEDIAKLMKRADAKGGPRFALEEWMRAGEEDERKYGNVPVVPMAFTYASLGNKNRAFAWLDKAVAQRNWMIIYLKCDNVWDPLRSDPRFTALLRRVGLPQ